jgi:hypothetical protein
MPRRDTGTAEIGKAQQIQFTAAYLNHVPIAARDDPRSPWAKSLPKAFDMATQRRRRAAGQGAVPQKLR